MRTTAIIATGAALVLGTPAYAGSPLPDQQLWTTLQVQGPVAGPVFVSADITMRASDAARGVNQVEPLFGVGVKVNKNLSLLVGGGDILNRSTGAAVDTHEHRFFQQAALKLGTLAGGALSTRIRLEERRLSTGQDTNLRLRTQLKWVRPLARGSKTALALSHESMFMLNDTDWAPPRGWNLMRNFIGLRRNIGKHFDVEGGYLNQYTQRIGARDRMDHTASLTFAVSF